MLVCHLTSVHARADTRIFLKECRSVVRLGHRCFLVVADGGANESREGVDIISVERQGSRWRRMLFTPWQVLRKAIEVDADVYHLHDPELLVVALSLKRLGKRVVFDSHEDVPRQIMDKHYLWRGFRVLVSWAFGLYERFVCRRLDAVVAATPTIRDKFIRWNCKAIDVNNFPILEEFDSQTTNGASGQKNLVCYVGAIYGARGIKEMVNAISLVDGDARLLLGGTFNDAQLAAEVRVLDGWKRVEELGWLDRTGVAKVMERSIAGLVTLHPTRAYMDSLPVKMFEYMSAGLPVIASDFPLWREIIETAGCGFCVNPLDPSEIAGAINWLISHPAEAREMGEKGRRAAHERFNWQAEERKLVELYASMA